jgi:hypothetical protein
VRKALALAGILLALPVFARPNREHRTFHPEALAWVSDQAAGSPEVPTHLRIEGGVEMVRQEPDGDLHIRLQWNGRVIVCECIPELPCKVPQVGQHIAVWGVHRFDAAPGHDEPGTREEKRRGWHEIHPVIGWEVVR